MTPWRAYAAGLTLRGYQARALERYRAVRADPATRAFYLVAPPGAGKTLLGLSMAEELALPAVCLSPNAAIQAQWLARLREHWVCVDPDLSELEPAPACSADPGDRPQALVSLTYQRLSVRGEGRRYHDNVYALHTALRDTGVRTVLLDECHHLSAEWGRAAESLCEALEDPFVIGLTATPVVQERGPLRRLLGEPDHEVSLPSVVRSGDLAPFQDLCHVVVPSPEEEESLHGNVARFERLFGRLRESEGDRMSLVGWCESLELEPLSPAGEPYADLYDLLREEPDLVAAWCRFWVDLEREPPAELPYLPELYEPSTLTDRLLLAAAYTARHLLASSTSSELAAEAVDALRTWGLAVTPGRVERRVGRVSRTLGFSRQKLQGVVEVLRTELEVMGEDLRALVLTDFEFPPEGRAALSCVDVMDLLTSIPDVDDVDPVLITGKSLLVDDDLWERFHGELDRLRARHGWEVQVEREAERGYWRLSGEGRDWNTRVQVALVTDLLERGTTRCLIGTRALLGEGWDCLRLNTLVDLTVVTSGVAVNQIRGRTIRRDPQADLKVANNWDILCLSSLGEAADLDRLQRKHERLYGITDDGQVERGVGHIHACFERVSPLALYTARDDVAADMHARARARLAVRGRWRVGEEFEDRDYRVLSFAAPRRRSGPPRAVPGGRETSAEAEAEPALELLPAAYSDGRRRLGQTVAAGAAGAAAALALGALVWPPLLVGVPLAALATHLGVRALAQRAFSPGELAETLETLARIVAGGMAAGAQPARPEVLRRDDAALRVVWRGASQDLAERLSIALAELLGPVTRPRWLLVEELTEAPAAASGWARLLQVGRTSERVFAVPRALARRSEAERLLERWRALRNARAALHHANSDNGRELLRRVLHRRPLEGEASIRDVWQ